MVGGDSAVDHGVAMKRDFGSLAGPVTEPARPPVRVRCRRLGAGAGRGATALTVLIVVANVVVEVGFVLWLLAPGHRAELDAAPLVKAANVFVIASVALVEGLRLLNVLSLSLASLLARDPVPARPDPGLRMAVPHHDRAGQ